MSSLYRLIDGKFDRIGRHATLGALVALALASGCRENDPGEPAGRSEVITSDERLSVSNSAGNLAASAIKDTYAVDFVFLPSIILRDGEAQLVSFQDNSPENAQRIMNLYDPTKDLIRFGTMKGSAIRDFIYSRVTNTLDMDLQVAGLNFDLRLQGGWPQVFTMNRDNGETFDLDRDYRVGLVSFFYRAPFPGYYFGDGLNFSFNEETSDFGSLRLAVARFLGKTPILPPFDERRGRVTNRVVGDAGSRRIFEIQGRAHLSPLLGYQVTTRGVVTAVGVPSKRDANDWAKFPGRELPTEVIIQDPEGDNDPTTSDAISVLVPSSNSVPKTGELIELTAVVHEQWTGGGMSGTSLRMIQKPIEVLAKNQPLPAPVLLGKGGRQILRPIPSSFAGDQNSKRELNIEEGIDFWESLEHMRVELVNPRVLGTEGGREDEARAKSGQVNFVEVILNPEGIVDQHSITDRGGNFYNPYDKDFNIETVAMVNHPLAPAINPNTIILEVGDTFPNLIGIMGFNRNNFGDGQMVFYYTEPTLTLPRQDHTPLSARPTTTLVGDEDHLTVATWNVENLGGSDRDFEVSRLQATGTVIATKLLCPDVINLPEIQDNNGDSTSGGSAADLTLRKLIAAINCPDADYRALNIDPIPFRDGGEKGGNIRVAMLYNAKRVGFLPRGNPTATSDTIVESDGLLNQNPGRLDPRNPVLEGSRKPLVAEFSFKGQVFYVIGVHLNSMLSEASPMGAVQPYRFRSEPARSEITRIVRNFVESLRRKNPNARILVAGDFNTYHQAQSLKLMSGDFLHNLMTYPGLFPADKWYTSNYGGNSGAIDYIFASTPLLSQEPAYEVLHINSNYMLKYSDHDPVLARFRF
jgi:hypothetical protein